MLCTRNISAVRNRSFVQYIIIKKIIKVKGVENTSLNIQRIRARSISEKAKNIDSTLNDKIIDHYSVPKYI